MERSELIEQYYDYGGKREDVQHLSPEKIEIKLVQQKKEYDDFMEEKKHYTKVMETKTYKNLCTEYNIEYDTERKNYWYVSQAVEQAKWKKKMNDSITNIAGSEEMEMDVSEATYRLEKLREMPETKDIANFEHQNAIIQLENVIKEKYGLSQKPLICSDSDLSNIMMLDDYDIDKNTHAFLDIQTPALKQSYKSRMLDILALRNAEIESKRREVEKIYNIEQTYQRLQNPPTKIIKRSGKIEVNKDYTDWIQEINDFARDLEFKRRSYSTRNEEIPFKDIIESINELIEQHEI